MPSLHNFLDIKFIATPWKARDSFVWREQCDFLVQIFCVTLLTCVISVISTNCPSKVHLYCCPIFSLVFAINWLMFRCCWDRDEGEKINCLVDAFVREKTISFSLEAQTVTASIFASLSRMVNLISFFAFSHQSRSIF